MHQLASLFLLLALLPDIAFTAWTLQQPDLTVGSVVSTELSIDTSGYAHVVYLPGGAATPALRYLRWDGGISSQSVVDTCYGGLTPARVSMALDGNSLPGVSYMGVKSAENWNLKYAKWDGVAWSTQVVDNSNNVGHWSSIKYNPITGHPVIAYAGGSALKIARWDGISWNIETIDAGSGYPSVVMDSAGNIHVAYAENNVGLKYAVWAGVAWSTQTVAVGAFADISISLDENVSPGIAYTDYNSMQVKYAHWNGAWQIETIDAGYRSVIAMFNGNPLVAYDGRNLTGTKLARRYAAGWTTHTVNASVPSSLSLWAVSDNSIKISAGNTSGLRYYSLTNTSPSLNWVGDINYVLDGVDPQTGDSDTSFIFKVKYEDVDGDAPLSGYPKLRVLKGGNNISGSPFSMSYVSGGHSSGSTYSLAKTFLPGSDYVYRFEAYDAYGSSAPGTAAEAVAGPVVSNHAPALSWSGDANYSMDGIDPETGNRAGTYTYKVMYSDADNESPLVGYPRVYVLRNGVEIAGSPFNMTFVSGTNISGAIYSATATLVPGNYSYYFEAKDAGGADAGGPPALERIGPMVSNVAPFLAWTGESEYLSDGLSPKTGNTTTSYLFRVRYSDADADAPDTGFPKVHIKKNGTDIAGSPFSMNYVSGVSSTGAIYTLAKNLSAGEYSYFFEAPDIYSGVATSEPTKERAGLIVIGDAVVPAAQEVKVYHGVFKPGQDERTSVAFNLTTPATITVKVYDGGGRRVRDLYSGTSTSGLNTIQWDGKNDSGAKVSSGVYTIKIEGGGLNQSKRVVVVR